MGARGLGKGMNSIIPEGSLGMDLLVSQAKQSVEMMDIRKIEPDREQPRKEFDADKIAELADSIKQHGVLQPLLVQKCKAESGDYYKIIAGERRWRAAKQAGLTEIPVLVKDCTQEEVFAISLIENIQREDLNPMEEAQAYQRLMKEYNLTQEKIAEKLGKSRSGIANSLRLLKLAPEAQELLSHGELSTGHAKVLLGLEDEKKQAALAAKCVAEDLSVRQLEQLLKKAEAKSEGKETPAEPKKKSAEELAYEALSNELRDIFGTRVNILPGPKKSKIEIEYYSEEDLERILDLLKKAR